MPTRPLRAALVLLLAGSLLGCQAFAPRIHPGPGAEASTSGVEEAEEVEAPDVMAAELEAPLAPATVVAEAPVAGPREDRFLGADDAPILEVLAHGEIARIERGRGGRSLGFKIWFADGSRAYFKPEQSAGSTRWYAEIASYHLDRALGLGRTAPSVARTLPYDVLARAAGRDARLDEIVARDGEVRGAMIHWIEGPLTPAPLAEGWERWVRVDARLPAVDPYVAPPHYRRALRARPTRHAVAEAPDREDRAAELSDLVVFDYLTANQDRWGGNYTNVRTQGEGGPIVYLDNGAAFRPGRHQRDGLLDARLEAVQRFGADTLEAVRALDVDALAAELEDAGVTLSARQRRGLAERQAHVLEHAEAMRAAHGEAAAL